MAQIAYTTGQYKTRTADHGLGIKHGLGMKCGLQTVYIKTALQRETQSGQAKTVVPALTFL